MKKFIYLILIMTVWVASCNPYGSQIPRQMVGNYVDPNNGKWEYGFFEEFAIYDNDFWDYASVKDSEITLSKASGEQISLKIEQSDDPFLIVNGKKVMKYNTVLEPDPDNFCFKYQQFKGIEKDTTMFKPITYNIDTAVIRIYIRNTAKGIRSFSRRNNNRVHTVCVNNNIDSRLYCVPMLSSNDHYGYRFEFKVPVLGVSELPMSVLLSDYGYYDELSINYIVEPNDTLMFYFDEDIEYIRNAFDIYHCITLCSGGNYRFNTEKNATVGLHFFGVEPNGNLDSLAKRFNNAIDKCAVPVSEKYKKIVKLKISNPIIHNADSMQLGINEIDILQSHTEFYFGILCDEVYHQNYYYQSSLDSLAAHPNWIVKKGWSMNKDYKNFLRTHPNEPNRDYADTISSGPNYLIDVQKIRDLGFSDEYIEFYRLKLAVDFFNPDLENNPLQDYELESIMRNIKRADYKAYLEDRINFYKFFYGSM